MVVGGTYAGQVVIWDTRRKSNLPVRRSALGNGEGGGRAGRGAAGPLSGHSHPVYGLALRATDGSASAAAAAALVSTSTDGMVRNEKGEHNLLLLVSNLVARALLRVWRVVKFLTMCGLCSL